MNSKTNRNRKGSTIIVVMGMTLLGTLAAGSIIGSVMSRSTQASKQVALEQAFYVAQAGAERAATYVAAGNETTTTLTGTLGSGSYSSEIECIPGSGAEIEINVTSVGTVNGVSKTVRMNGLRRVSWARYALWYDSEVSKLWMVPGEKFGGRVYSKPQFHFHNIDLATKGQVHFFDQAWSAAATIEKASSAVNPIFDRGLSLSASVESMASVDFTELFATANTSGLVLWGNTTIVVEGTTLKVTNARKSWTNKSVPIPANGMVYVKTSTSGTTTTRTGDLTVSGPAGLEGRLTIVADNDIKIVNHLTYNTNPQTDPTSTDALGLIAKRNIAVQTSAPNNLQIYGHLICQNGGFGVVSYNSGSARGIITVYGGIVNKVRNAVGTTSGTGYLKNYVYDTRFARNPPPNYPKVLDELEWRRWDG